MNELGLKYALQARQLILMGRQVHPEDSSAHVTYSEQLAIVEADILKLRAEIPVVTIRIKLEIV